MVEEGMGWRSMPVFEWLDRTVSIYGGGGRWDVGVAVGVTAVAGISLAAIIIISSSRDGIKSPWSRRQRKRPLSRQQWDSFFTSDGTFHDGGMLFLKTVRSGGVEPTIRVEVWPFLLGVYELSSSETERSEIKTKNKREYKKLRQRCFKLLEQCADSSEQPKEIGEDSNKEGPIVQEDPDSPGSEHSSIARESLPILREGITNSTEDLPKNQETSEAISSLVEENQSKGRSPVEKHSHVEDEQETMQTSSITEGNVEIDQECTKLASHKGDTNTPKRTTEDFETWQRIICLDAIRANAEWVMHSRTQAAVPDDKAEQAARAVGLKDYDHLEPSRVYHAARLVAVLEAYAIYDPEIGYCQGMSDLLSPILTVMEDDDEAFWCFVGFMKKARHNFRLDEVGIRRQLSFVSKIIKYKDVDLYRHLEKLQAEDCFFVYRMVVVLFRRELTFEQTVCLWEVMWADQAAIRAGIGKPVWGRTRLQAPPTDDLLLYAIAACVLQRRKLIIEKYSGMDEIIRECNSMAGQLDVWKLLDDAHDLVVTLHDKI